MISKIIRISITLVLALATLSVNAQNFKDTWDIKPTTFKHKEYFFKHIPTSYYVIVDMSFVNWCTIDVYSYENCCFGPKLWITIEKDETDIKDIINTLRKGTKQDDKISYTSSMIKKYDGNNMNAACFEDVLLCECDEVTYKKSFIDDVCLLISALYLKINNLC